MWSSLPLWHHLLLFSPLLTRAALLVLTAFALSLPLPGILLFQVPALLTPARTSNPCSNVISVPPTPTYVQLLLCYIYNCLSVAFNLQIHCIISYVFCLLPAPPPRMRAEIFFLYHFHLLLYPCSLEKCLMHNKVSKNICWMN